MMDAEEQVLPWKACKTLTVDLDQPLVERYAACADEMKAVSADLLQAVYHEIHSVAPKAIHLAHWVNLRTGWRFDAESRAFAKCVGTDWRRIMVAGMAYELMAMGCSTVALATNRGPVLARNMDFEPESSLARNTYTIVNRRAGEKVSVIAGWPGAPGVVTGLSARGFAFALNAVWSSEGIRKTGYPALLWLRRVMDEAEDFADAVERLKHKKLMSACLLTVVGVGNEERVVIERTPTKYKLRKAQGDQPLVATNDFRTDIDTGEAGLEHELAQTSCGRFEALSAYCRLPEAKNPTDDMLLYGLSDDAVIQEITAQHIIARPAENHLGVYVPRRLLG